MQMFIINDHKLVPAFIFPFPTLVPDCGFQLEPGEQSEGKMKAGKIRRTFFNQLQARVGPLYIEVYRMEECTPNQGAPNGK